MAVKWLLPSHTHSAMKMIRNAAGTSSSGIIFFPLKSETHFRFWRCRRSAWWTLNLSTRGSYCPSLSAFCYQRWRRRRTHAERRHQLMTAESPSIMKPCGLTVTHLRIQMSADTKLEFILTHLTRLWTSAHERSRDQRESNGAGFIPP